jgi:hypothetical protein
MARARPSTLERARGARELARRWLEDHGLAGAIGLAREGDGYVLKASLPRALPPQVVAPQAVGGVPLRVEVTGPVRARRSR